jgi:hypothetical protein
MDIHFQPVNPDAMLGNKVFTFGFVSALKVSGIQMLVNRWFKTFFTPLGSDVLYPSSGTVFANLLGVNINLNNPAIEDAVIMAIDSTNSQLQEQDDSGAYPDSESLGYAKLMNIAYDTRTSSVSIWVEMSNKQGEQLTVKLMELSDR